MKDEIQNITKLLRNIDNVIFALLFGSYSTGRVTEQSDIDLGIFFKEIPDFFLLEDLRCKITFLTQKRADIVTLNDAAPVICMQVLKTGRPLFLEKSKEYNDFFVKTIITYDDLKRTRKIVEENLLRGRIYAGS